MKKLFIACSLMLLGVLGAQCQVLSVSDTLLFTGVVFDEATGEPLPGVNCRLGEGRGTASDAEGHFRIPLLRGDSVLFTHVGFRPCLVVVPDTLYEREYMLGVFLSPDTVRLSEALILRRWGAGDNRSMARARNNMRGILRQAYDPNRPMDAEMNQRRVIEEYARSVEMKGHVDVGFGVGTHTADALRLLRLRKRVRERQEGLTVGEVDLLKKIYYSEKSGKPVE